MHFNFVPIYTLIVIYGYNLIRLFFLVYFSFSYSVSERIYLYIYSDIRSCVLFCLLYFNDIVGNTMATNIRFII